MPTTKMQSAINKEQYNVYERYQPHSTALQEYVLVVLTHHVVEVIRSYHEESTVSLVMLFENHRLLHLKQTNGHSATRPNRQTTGTTTPTYPGQSLLVGRHP